MADQIWTTLVGAAIPVIASFGVVLLTRERSSGSESTTIKQAAKDVEAMQLTVVNLQLTVTALTTTVGNLAATIERQGGWIREVERTLNLSIGREEGRRRD